MKISTCTCSQKWIGGRKLTLCKIKKMKSISVFSDTSNFKYKNK